MGEGAMVFAKAVSFPSYPDVGGEEPVVLAQVPFQTLIHSLIST